LRFDLRRSKHHSVTVPGNTIRRAQDPTGGDRAVVWKRVGQFVLERRQALKLSQNDILRALGYKGTMMVSNIERGLVGLPVKRVYAWADILHVPRDAFFRFVTGESMDPHASGDSTSRPAPAAHLSPAEAELLARYRALPPKFQRRLRDHATELEVLARAASTKR
jgi:transcriptional regulator with XRE-family HTH domain